MALSCLQLCSDHSVWLHCAMVGLGATPQTPITRPQPGRALPFLLSLSTGLQQHQIAVKRPLLLTIIWEGPVAAAACWQPGGVAWARRAYRRAEGRRRCERNRALAALPTGSGAKLARDDAHPPFLACPIVGREARVAVPDGGGMAAAGKSINDQRRN